MTRPRAKGIEDRMEFFRGHYLAHLGAERTAALFTNEGGGQRVKGSETGCVAVGMEAATPPTPPERRGPSGEPSRRARYLTPSASGRPSRGSGPTFTQLRLRARRRSQRSDGGPLAALPVGVVTLEDVAEQMRS